MQVSDLTKEELAQVREAFNIFDKNGDGTISSEELGSVMRSLGLNPSEGEIMDMIDSADIDKDGSVDLNEFISLMPKFLGDSSFGTHKNAANNSISSTSNSNTTSSTSGSTTKNSRSVKHSDEDEESELRKAFESFDTDRSGLISPAELRAVMKSIGETLTDDEVKAIISEVDNNGDGHIDYHEFCRLYKGR